MSYFAPTILNADLPGMQPVAPLPIIYERADPPRWAYRVLTVDLREEPPLDEARLTELGTEGWLLAGILQLPASLSAAAAAHVTYYFVRAV
ncbi:MAG TPA: hypothetical protein VJR48_13330 [Ktedonobacterales bacterium]|jgi:hypothetical protein|nr:MAG: hypothetical protein OJF49_001369 [Ktedonobacterales bacterium]HKT39351.1 hypothetical protein [Ktedonobacterales bacterium]